MKDGDRLVKINVRQLLSGIEAEDQRREEVARVTNIYVGGNVGGNFVAGDHDPVESS